MHELVLAGTEIIAPHDFGYQLTHYNIYPWVAEGESLVRILRLPSGAVAKVTATSEGETERPQLRLVAHPDRLSRGDVQCAFETVSWSLGVCEDLRPFYALCSRDPVLSAAVGRRYGGKGKSYPTVFEALIGVVCAQNTQFRRL